MVYHSQILWYRVINDQFVLIGREQVSALLEAPLKLCGHLNSIGTQEGTCLSTPVPDSCRILCHAKAQAMTEAMTYFSWAALSS